MSCIGVDGSGTYFPLLNNSELKILIPHACMKEISLRPKMSGIKAFHSHMTGRANAADKAKTKRMAVRMTFI